MIAKGTLLHHTLQGRGSSTMAEHPYTNQHAIHANQEEREWIAAAIACEWTRSLRLSG